MDASKMERPVQEVIADKVIEMHNSLDRAQELVKRASRIIERMAQSVPPCEGVCPVCGKVWDQ